MAVSHFGCRCYRAAAAVGAAAAATALPLLLLPPLLLPLLPAHQLRRTARDLHTLMAKCIEEAAWIFETFLVNCDQFVISEQQISHLNIKVKIKSKLIEFSFLIKHSQYFCICRCEHLHLGNQSELDTCSYEHLFSSNDHATPQICRPSFLNHLECVKPTQCFF